MKASWTHPYIGIPYRPLGRSRLGGCDCYGLVRLVYGEAGITLPSYEVDPTSVDETAATLAAARAGGAWTEILIADARPMDLILFGGPLPHVGLWVAPGLMLHAPRSGTSGITRYDRPPWRDRLEGVARHWIMTEGRP